MGTLIELEESSEVLALHCLTQGTLPAGARNGEKQGWQNGWPYVVGLVLALDAQDSCPASEQWELLQGQSQDLTSDSCLL